MSCAKKGRHALPSHVLSTPIQGSLSKLPSNMFDSVWVAERCLMFINHLESSSMELAEGSAAKPFLSFLQSKHLVSWRYSTS